MDIAIKFILDELKIIREELQIIKETIPDKELFLTTEESRLLLKSYQNEENGKLTSRKLILND